MALESINPATGKLIKSFQEMSEKEIDFHLQKSAEAFEKWKFVSFSKRASLMKKAADILRNNKKRYGTLMAREMGKPINSGIAEAEKSAWACDYYADNAEKLLQPEFTETDAKKSYVRFEPLGPVLAIMPWNFPFWQVFRFAAPALMAGNTGLLKHSSNVSLCAIEIEKIFTQAGFPGHVFKTLLISSKKIPKIIHDKRVKAVTLTGSTSAGTSVAVEAGKAVKKAVLELGGSDPFVVLADADVGKAAEVACTARLINSGQSCISAKRFIVVDKVAARFTKLLKEKMSKIKVGDPLNPENTVGPLARPDLAEALDKQVQLSIKKGAKAVLGGKKKQGKGAFYPVTLLANVKKGMPAYDEETFGPVGVIIMAKDDKDAIRIANDTIYGLGASIWTKNTKKGEELTKQIEAGAVFVNGLVKSDPRLPFGGVKQSGYGRELGKEGIKEFVNKKTVWVG